ncbi:hypothetical protein KFE18_09420 [Clostridiaceae bacterium Marseille-Q4143]|nr:hypothetical protein KFE18_09420 [Clostridiaceae bacterium Marseille-Q4143]
MKKAVSYIAIVLFACSLLLYNKYGIPQAVQMPLEEDSGEYTTDGFETPEEAVTYLLYHMNQDHLDAALRVCAISDIAEYFNMTLFLQYTQQYGGATMVLPSELENDAYIEISRMRFAYYYAQLIEQYRSFFLNDTMPEVLQVMVSEPEQKDGMYYQKQESIGDILGARDICEVSALVETNDRIQELRFSLAKYKKYWKVFLLCPMEDWQSDQLWIQDVTELTDRSTIKITQAEETANVILPVNYYVLDSESENTIKDLTDNFFFYLQRGDVVSAMSYLTPTDIQETPLLTQLERQANVAARIQQLYYEMFLYDVSKLEWAGRHYEDAPETIPDLLNLENMIYASYTGVNVLYDDGTTAQIQGGFSYGWGWYGLILNLVNNNGWTISSVE